MYRLINVGLRGLTLLSKFLLIFFLAKFLAADAVGLYGLLSAGIGYGIYVLGCEFYNFANRELIGSERSAWLRLIRDQAVLYVLLYMLFLPVLVGVFWRGWLPWAFFSWFLLLLLLEHIAQEANRILVATSQQLLASVVLFLRSGLWCLVVVLLMWGSQEARTLEVTLAAWVLGCLVACGVALYSFSHMDKSELRLPIDWAWIRRGVVAALPLLVASLAVRGIYTFDRYWVEHVASLHVLGAYVLYIGMATAILSFLDAGVVVFFFPKLVQAAKQKQGVLFEKVMRELAVNVGLVVVVLSFCCWLSSFWIVQWLNQPVYQENIALLYWLLGATSLYGLSMVPHLGLYAYGEDKQILYAQVFGLLVFIGVAYFAADWGAVSVAWAMTSAFLVVLAWKTFAYHKLQKRIRAF
ncbi:hypothetical protein KDX30_03775 [Pseudomonas sp. CDFA 553]|uniref:lipopolysaccharide biosynthesis protein n=1 Tax=Pseudomonas quasicaspiana TaxID=2829821 RepID=UPI001E5E532D|nr:hypothetical protein [Pseudomonas quasicaspiana]MCD5987017.1 hypothetical protein [Pseudomonas quasicaspiana]